MSKTNGKSPYCMMRPNGDYEYGWVVYGEDRRRDKLVPVETGLSYEVAEARMYALLAGKAESTSPKGASL